MKPTEAERRANRRASMWTIVCIVLAWFSLQVQLERQVWLKMRDARERIDQSLEQLPRTCNALNSQKLLQAARDQSLISKQTFESGKAKLRDFVEALMLVDGLKGKPVEDKEHVLARLEMYPCLRRRFLRNSQ